MSTNFNSKGKLKFLTLCLSTLFCFGLGAEDVKVAVQDPVGSQKMQSYIDLAKNAFLDTVTDTRGFQVVERDETKQKQMAGEHEFQRMSGLVSDKEARKLGEQMGADYIFSSEIKETADSSIMVSCRALNVVSGRIVSNKSEILEGPTSKQFMDACKALMTEFLKKADASGDNVTGAGPKVDALSGLDNDIRKMLINNNSNAKWNKNKKSNYSIEVDLTGVRKNENRQYKTIQVSGTIGISLTDADSGSSSEYEVEIEKFTEMGEDRIRENLKKQVQSKGNEIIRELMSGLE